MNRLFFRPEQSGMTKTDAAAQTLASINPDVALESYTMNITTLQGFDGFKASLTDGSGGSRVNLVLSCVDNYEARMTVNQVFTVLCLHETSPHHMDHVSCLSIADLGSSSCVRALYAIPLQNLFSRRHCCGGCHKLQPGCQGPKLVILLLCRCVWS